MSHPPEIDCSKYPDSKVSWDSSDSPCFNKGVIEALNEAVNQHPIYHGHDWQASIACPRCGHDFPVDVPWVIPFVEEEFRPEVIVDVRCLCQHQHDSRDDKVDPYGCGPGRQVKLPVRRSATTGEPNE